MKESLTLKDIFRIFLRRKWAFIITLIVIFTMGLLYTFIKTPVYESNSRLKLSGVYYNDDLLKYFPEESADIDVYPSNQRSDELEIAILNSLSKQIKDKEFLAKIAVHVGNDVTAEDVLPSIVTLIDNNNRILLVKISYDDPVISFNINDNIISTFLGDKYVEKESALNDLIHNIQEKLNRISAAESEDKKVYEDLSAIRYSLEKNKDYIINTLVITQEPSMPDKAVNVNHTKEILVALLLSILAGLIAVFLPDVFLPLKKRNE